MTTDDTILLTGLHGDDYPARVVFDDFDDSGVPHSGLMQVQDEDGEWHTVERLEPPRVAAYWADFERCADDVAAEGLIDQRRAA